MSARSRRASPICRAHDVRWALAAALLSRDSGRNEGLLWQLLKCGDKGLAWVMHTLPHLGWLLSAGEAVHCGGGVVGRSAEAQLQRSALSAALKVCCVPADFSAFCSHLQVELPSRTRSRCCACVAQLAPVLAVAWYSMRRSFCTVDTDRMGAAPIR